MLKISVLFKKIQVLQVNNSIILRIKNAKFSCYYFYMNLNIWGDFKICISVPLSSKVPLRNDKHSKIFSFFFLDISHRNHRDIAIIEIQLRVTKPPSTTKNLGVFGKLINKAVLDFGLAKSMKGIYNFHEVKIAQSRRGHCKPIKWGLG